MSSHLDPTARTAAMSIVNSEGAQVRPAPKVGHAREFISPKIRLRNLRWLATMRQFEFETIVELAEYLNRKPRIVGLAIQTALVDEVNEHERALSGDDSPVIDDKFGMTLDEVLYLFHEYPETTELGGHPDFRQWIDPLVCPMQSAPSCERPLRMCEAA